LRMAVVICRRRGLIVGLDEQAAHVISAARVVRLPGLLLRMEVLVL
jgi:hypothetical protein